MDLKLTRVSLPQFLHGVGPQAPPPDDRAPDRRGALRSELICAGAAHGRPAQVDGPAAARVRLQGPAAVVQLSQVPHHPPALPPRDAVREEGAGGVQPLPPHVDAAQGEGTGIKNLQGKREKKEEEKIKKKKRI